MFEKNIFDIILHTLHDHFQFKLLAHASCVLCLVHLHSFVQPRQWRADVINVKSQQMPEFSS